jgi:hypothetical protein
MVSISISREVPFLQTPLGAGYPGTFKKKDVIPKCCDARTLLRNYTHLSVNASLRSVAQQRGRAHS